ncbi:hypothetical protein C0583_03595 [Candidatus Parcubacteria bacterium]|nr:MAG: hypothetical protein C0583_03595 [Candidatus Parcubacteria bacterium]
MAKPKKSASSVLLSIFIMLAISLGASFWFFQNFIYLEAKTNFKLTMEKKTVINEKNKELKDFDFGLFDGDNFKVLKKGYWDEFLAEEVEVNNPYPFKEEL